MMGSGTVSNQFFIPANDLSAISQGLIDFNTFYVVGLDIWRSFILQDVSIKFKMVQNKLALFSSHT